MENPGPAQQGELGFQQKTSYLPYRRALLSPARIKELSALRPSRALTDLAWCWACIVAAWCAVATHPAWWTILLAIPVIGNRYYAIFIIGHDGMHRRMFPNIKRNDFWTDLLVFAPIGAITRLNNRNHLAHHQYLGQQQDPDRHKHACFNKGDRLSLLGFLSGLTSVWNSARSVFLNRGTTDQKNHRNQRLIHSSSDGYRLRDFALLAGWFVALAGGLTWFIGWWAYPVLWLFPVYAFMYLGDNLRAFAEHSHPESDQTADGHRLITFLSVPLERMFVAPMNMNYHTVHHLWPSIPYYNLPTADSEIRHPAEALGLEWRGSYFAYLVRYWIALPIAECLSHDQRAGH
jgi:fatty acid desaturase